MEELKWFFENEAQFRAFRRNVKAIGFLPTALLNVLVKFDYQDDADFGWFEATYNRVKEYLPTNDKAQKNAIDKLVELNLIEVTRKGQPAKRYIRINPNSHLILDNIVREKLGDNEEW